jgi:hypothetical protein
MKAFEVVWMISDRCIVLIYLSPTHPELAEHALSSKSVTGQNASRPRRNASTEYPFSWLTDVMAVQLLQPAFG